MRAIREKRKRYEKKRQNDSERGIKKVNFISTKRKLF